MVSRQPTHPWRWRLQDTSDQKVGRRGDDSSGGANGADAGAAGGAGASGKGGIKRDGGGGHGAAGVACVDIIVASDLVADPPLSPYPLSGGVWRTGSGLHVAWKPDVGGPDDHLLLYLATYNAAISDRQRVRHYGVCGGKTTARIRPLSTRCRHLWSG